MKSTGIPRHLAKMFHVKLFGTIDTLGKRTSAMDAAAKGGELEHFC